MLDELIASLVVSRSAGAIAFGRPSTPTVASLEVQASLTDTCSPPRMVQLSFVDAEAPRVDGDDRLLTSMPTSPSALVREFARCVSATLKTPILKAPPRRRTHRSSSSVTIRRSTRLAAKCASRAPNATLQALKVIVSKWEHTASQPSNNQVVAGFQWSFQGPLDSAKRDALSALMKYDVAEFECIFEEAY